jgi:CRP/FNR family transcriptional regulator
MSVCGYRDREIYYDNVAFFPHSGKVGQTEDSYDFSVREMTHSSEKIQYLRVLPCLTCLDAQDLDVIGQSSNERRIPKNSVIFRESDPVRFFFIVRSGSIKLFKMSPEGRELIVKIIGPGDYFCCAPLYAGERYFVSSVALEDSSLIVIPSDDFKERVCGSMGDMGLKVVAGLCGRIRYLSNLIEDLTFKDVEQRLIAALLRLADEKSPEENIVSLSLTHQDIASMIGTVREVVSRTMSKLKKDGGVIESTIRGFTLDRTILSNLLRKKYPLPRDLQHPF